MRLRPDVGRAALVFILLSVGAADPALGQDALPRCGGWPHSPGQPGLIIAPGGRACRGTLFRTRYRPGTIVNVEVTPLISRGSTLRLLDLMNFIYEPAPGQRGYERLAVDVTGAYGGRSRTFRAIYLATTEDEFRASGGTNSSPPPGFTDSPQERRRLFFR